jgi:hypothetical protein
MRRISFVVITVFIVLGILIFKEPLWDYPEGPEILSW